MTATVLEIYNSCKKQLAIAGRAYQYVCSMVLARGREERFGELQPSVMAAAHPSP